MPGKSKKILPLDGAGIIYPYVAEANWNTVFRIVANLKIKVEVSAIPKAISALKEKYPYFFMTLSKNGMRYYLTECEVDVEEMYGIDKEPCKPFDIESGKPLIRFLYSENSIVFELFHSITDGRGALEFMKAFLKEYQDCGNSDEHSAMLTNTEDIFEKIYNDGGKSVSRIFPFAYEMSRKESVPFNYEAVQLPSRCVVDAAHRYGVSVSVLFCAMHIKAIAETRTDTRRQITISIPIELRKMFDFASCRNSSLYFLVSATQEETKDFKALLANIKSQFEEKLNPEDMRNMAYSNVKQAKMKLFDLLPLVLKKKVLKIGYTFFGEYQFTSAVTSIGVIKLDEDLDELVEDIYYSLGRQYTHPINVAASTYKDKTSFVVSYDIKPNSYLRELNHLIKAYIYE